MWKKWMAVGLMMLAAAGAAAVQAEEGAAAHVSADGWTAREKDGVITVTDEKGKEFAFLSHQPEEGVNVVLMAEDYNFDGKADIAALTSMGTANAYYTVWLRDAEGGFLEYPAFREICAPMCEPVMERIGSFERVSAAEYAETEYRWLEGELKAVWKRNIRYLDANGVNVKVTESIPGDEEIVVNEWEMPSEMWYEASELMDNAEWIMFALDGENISANQMAYGGTVQIGGSLYHAYSVLRDGGTTGMVYMNPDKPTEALLDDTADDAVNPKWQVSPSGEKTEIAS